MQCPLLDRLLVIDAEPVLDRDDLPGVRKRGGRVRAVQVPHERVHDIERQNREELDPPVENVAVGKNTSALQRRTLSGLCVHVCVSLSAGSFLRWPIANAGAPSMLTNSMHPYHNNPAAIARLSGRWCATRNECRKRTSAPRRIASSPSRRRTRSSASWSLRSSASARPARSCWRAVARSRTPRRPTAAASGARSTGTPWRRSGASRLTPMHRADQPHPVLVFGERPAIRG